MNYDSIIKSLDEAIQISDGKLKVRKQRVTILPIDNFTNYEIKSIRMNLNLTQLAFSHLIGVSKKTIEAWENGRNSPSGPARRIIGLLKEDYSLLEKYNLITLT